jgi:hypothetical protein
MLVNFSQIYGESQEQNLAFSDQFSYPGGQEYLGFLKLQVVPGLRSNGIRMYITLSNMKRLNTFRKGVLSANLQSY